MTVTPDVKRIVVLRRGTWKGLKGETLVGGQRPPSSSEEFKAEWKKAQKKEKKNMISETIKSNIPHFKPVTTFSVCRP